MPTYRIGMNARIKVIKKIIENPEVQLAFYDKKIQIKKMV